MGVVVIVVIGALCGWAGFGGYDGDMFHFGFVDRLLGVERDVSDSLEPVLTLNPAVSETAATGGSRPTKAINIGDGVFQLDAPNLYVAMTRGLQLLVLCSKTMLLNPRRK